ncbi:MAG: recombinase family protein [Candidatus Saccharimonadales bacterium]
MVEEAVRCVVLARVSSRAQEEEGYSLDAQERLANEYCPKKQLKVAKTFRIAETASKATERRVFNEMMKYLTANRIKQLVVEKADRLTRSFKDMVMIDDWLEADDSRHVHLIKDSLVMYKHSRSQDKLNWGVKVLFAKNYTDNLREEVYKGRMEKLADGWLPGKPPYGYKTIGEKKHKIHIPDPEKVPLLIKLFESYLNPSHSLTTITRYAGDIGIRTSKGRPYSRSTLAENILANPFYTGKNRWQGIDYDGKQELFLDEDLWSAVQAKMHRKTPPKYQKHDPDLRGIIQCEDCGGTISWEFQKGTWYGHCNRYKGCPSKKYATQKIIEEQLFKHFEKLLCPSPEIAEWIIEALKAKHQNDMYDYSASVEQLRSNHDSLKRSLDILYEDRLSERISVERYDQLSKEKVQQQKELETQITGLADRSRKQLHRGVDVLEKSQQAAVVYATKSPAEKRILLSELFTSLKLDGTALHVTYNPYTEAISKRVERHRKVVSNFRTKENTPNNGGDTELVTALRTVWRARPDLNRRSPP